MYLCRSRCCNILTLSRHFTNPTSMNEWMMGKKNNFISSRGYIRMFLPGTISPGTISLGTICELSIISSQHSGTECLYDKALLKLSGFSRDPSWTNWDPAFPGRDEKRAFPYKRPYKNFFPYKRPGQIRYIYVYMARSMARLKMARFK